MPKAPLSGCFCVHLIKQEMAVNSDWASRLRSFGGIIYTTSCRVGVTLHRARVASTAHVPPQCLHARIPHTRQRGWLEVRRLPSRLPACRLDRDGGRHRRRSCYRRRRLWLPHLPLRCALRHPRLRDPLRLPGPPIRESPIEASCGVILSGLISVVPSHVRLTAALDRGTAGGRAALLFVWSVLVLGLGSWKFDDLGGSRGIFSLGGSNGK